MTNNSMTNEPTHSLINYPESARLERVIPKSKFYEKANVNSALRELFVRQVDKIIWQYKLAPETIRLAGKSAVPEIQIFSIELKAAQLSHDVLRAIDLAIPLPIIFELHHAGQIQVMAAHKNLLTTTQIQLSDYFASPWQSDGLVRQAMPYALDMVNLYEQLLQRLIPHTKRMPESITHSIERAQKIQKMQTEIQQLTRKMLQHKQFNRKIEINQQLRQAQNELDRLLKDE